MAAAIVIALRVIVPFSILRWPLGGALASMLVDALDVVLVDALARAFGEPLEFGAFYSQIDKWLDTWYLGIEGFVAWRWPESRQPTVGQSAASHMPGARSRQHCPSTWSR